jgi:hypothetical protein
MSQMIIYQNENGDIKVDVRFEENALWLSQAQICELFGKAKSTVSEHITNVFEEGELNENAVVRNFRTTANDGKNYDVSSAIKHFHMPSFMSACGNIIN